MTAFAFDIAMAALGVNGPELRHEALLCRMGVRDRHLPAVVAVG